MNSLTSLEQSEIGSSLYIAS